MLPRFLRPYAGTDVVDIVIFDVTGSAFSTDTLAAGDVKISIDGGAYANVTNLPTNSTGDAPWTPTSGELTGKRIKVRVLDQTSPQVFLPQEFVIETYGHASAMHPKMGWLTGDPFADTTNIKTRLPAALVSGRMDSNVGAMDADTLTGTALAASAVTEIEGGALANIQSRLPAALIGGRLDVTVGAMQADVVTSSAVAASAVTEIQTGLATSGAVASVGSDVVLVYGKVDTEVGTLQTTVDAINTKIGTPSSSVSADIAAIPAAPSATTIRNALLTWELWTGYSLARVLRALGSVLRGTKTGSDTGTEVFTSPAGGETVTFTTPDSVGNRSAVTDTCSNTP